MELERLEGLGSWRCPADEAGCQKSTLRGFPAAVTAESDRKSGRQRSSDV